jgi:hypothetical protein
LHWGQWPQTKPDSARVAIEHDLFALYEFFLKKGTPHLRSSAWHLARHRIKETESLTLKLSGKTIKTKRLRRHPSLGYLVDILVSVGISPDDIAV